MQQKYVEISLQFVIERCGIVAGGADRRLNAIHNLLTLLTERWRGRRRIELERDVRMSAATREALVQWVTEIGDLDASSRERLAAYQASSVVDEQVSAGLIRIFMPAAEA